MRRLWTATTLALSCAVLTTLAFPQPRLDQPQTSWPNQQLPFTPHHTRPNASPDSTLGVYARFDHEQVYRVQVSSMEQLQRLGALVEEHNLDLWSNLRVGTVDIRVPASKIKVFEGTTNDMSSTVMIPNLQDLIPDQAPAMLRQLTQSQTNWDFTNNTFWESYHDFATLNNFTETMVQQFPKLVKRVSIGHTHEGREIFGLSIHGFKSKKDKKKKKKKGLSFFFDREQDDEEPDTFNYDNDSDDDKDTSGDEQEESALDNSDEQEGFLSRWSWLWKQPRKTYGKPSKPKKHPKTIVIHAGQHAREWIGPAVVTYIAKELILGYRLNKKITRLVDEFEFIVVPVLNADGYVHTWESNRMWRKNRQPTSISICPGIDPNRNWGYKWNTGGSSSNPCNEAYHGPEAFAAKEAKMMADFIQKHKNVVSYIDFHAYSQLWMSPFGGDCKHVPRDDEDIMEGALGAAKALHSVHGKRFAVGSICNVIYQSSGGSIDWTYAVGKVKYSYGVELRDTGRYGFLLPENEILPSSEETLAGVMYLANFIRKREKQWGYLV